MVVPLIDGLIGASIPPQPSACNCISFWCCFLASGPPFEILFLEHLHKDCHIKNITLVCIVGESGIGKTSMVHLGSNEERVSDACLWCSYIHIHAREVIRNETNEGTNLVCYKLAFSRDRTRLTWGFVDGWINRYESVFSDAENKNPSFWTSLFTLLNHGSWGSVLLFTPQSKAVAEVTGAMQTTHLDPLSD